jgi:hypothetical protein
MKLVTVTPLCRQCVPNIELTEDKCLHLTVFLFYQYADGSPCIINRNALWKDQNVFRENSLQTLIERSEVLPQTHYPVATGIDLFSPSIPPFLTFPICWTDTEHGSSGVRPTEACLSSLAWVHPARSYLLMMPQGIVVLSVCQQQLGYIVSFCCKDVTVAFLALFLFWLVKFHLSLSSLPVCNKLLWKLTSTVQFTVSNSIANDCMK